MMCIRDRYKGEWDLDLPNGDGTIISIQYEDDLQLAEGQTVSVRTETQGTFLNGLYHGTIYMTSYMNDGSVHAWTPITAINGIFQPLSSVPIEIESRDYYQNHIANEAFPVAIDQNNTELLNSGFANFVFGFEEDDK